MRSDCPDVDAGALYHYRLGSDAALYPDPASRSQPERPMGASQVVDPHAFAWTDDAWKGVTHRGPGALRDACRHVHAGRHLGGGGREAALPEGPRRHRGQHDAGQRVPGPLRLGLRRRRPLRPHPPLRHAGRPPALRRPRPRARPRRDPRRRLQPHRARREFPQSLRPGLFHRPPRHRMGRGAELRRAERHRHARPRRSPTPPIGSPNTISTGSGSTPPRTSTTTPTITSWRRWAARHARRPGRARSSSWPRTSRRIPISCARSTRAAPGSTACGTTTCTTPPWWRRPGATNSTTPTTKARRRSSSRRRNTAICSRARPTAATTGRAASLALDLAPDAFVTFVQNHDQVANAARGWRLHQLTSHPRARALTALSLLMPGTPMLFQGQEFWASAPVPLLRRPSAGTGRAGAARDATTTWRNFASLATASGQKQLADPEADDTFERCKLDWSEAERNAPIVAMHRDLLALRRTDRAFDVPPPPHDRWRRHRTGRLRAPLLRDRTATTG